MIRIAGIEDKEAFLSLCNRRVEEVFDEFIEAPKEERIILIEDKAIFIGMVVNTEKGKIATDVLWYVEPEERNQGIGTTLLEAFEYWAQKVGCDTIVMSSLHEGQGEEYFRERGYVRKGPSYVKEL